MKTQKGQLERQGNNFKVSVETNDGILPTAEQIEAYGKADPELLPLIRETATREQELRHRAAEHGMKVGRREQFFQHGLNYIGVISTALIIPMAGMAITWHLLINGHDVKGSVFGGATFIYMIGAIRSKMEKPAPQNKV